MSSDKSAVVIFILGYSDKFPPTAPDFGQNALPHTYVWSYLFCRTLTNTYFSNTHIFFVEIHNVGYFQTQKPFYSIFDILRHFRRLRLFGLSNLELYFYSVERIISFDFLYFLEPFYMFASETKYENTPKIGPHWYRRLIPNLKRYLYSFESFVCF